MRKKSKWYYHFPGNPYAYGPTTDRYYASEIRALLRQWWDLKRLPNGTEVWRA